MAEAIEQSLNASVKQERRTQLKKRASGVLVGFVLLTFGLSQRPDSGRILAPNLNYGENVGFWGRQAVALVTGDLFTRNGLDLVKEEKEFDVISGRKFDMKDVQINEKTDSDKADFSFIFADSSGKERRYHVYNDRYDPDSSLNGNDHSMFLSEDKESFLRFDYTPAEGLFAYVKYLNSIGFNHVDLEIKPNFDKSFYRFIYLPDGETPQGIYPGDNYFHSLKEAENYHGGVPGYWTGKEFMPYLGIARVVNVELDLTMHKFNGDPVWGVFAKVSSDSDPNSKIFRYFQTIPGNSRFDDRNRFFATTIGVDNGVFKTNK